jgi:MYXO-CTERM domain-containing protein
VIDADGRIVASIGPLVASTASLRMPPPHPPTPFSRFGHGTSAVFGALLLLAAAATRRRA